MGADGCISNGESKNKAKRATNSREGHVLQCMHTTKKNRKCAGMVMVAREDHSEELRGKKGCAEQN